MKCPGQDRRYWTEDAAYEVPCPSCGAAVEFFKDESSGRCANCGHRFSNPGADFSCAAWCSLAQECVGFTPGRRPGAERERAATAARLILAVKEELAHDPAGLRLAMTAYQRARELIVKEGGDPRITLASALLLKASAPQATAAGASWTRSVERARRILERAGFDEPAIERVCEIVRFCQTGGTLASSEFRVVWDAGTLANLPASNAAERQTALRKLMEHGLNTAAARETARRWLEDLLEETREDSP